jgi:hypothetical protein
LGIPLQSLDDVKPIVTAPEQNLHLQELSLAERSIPPAHPPAPAAGGVPPERGLPQAVPAESPSADSTVVIFIYLNRLPEFLVVFLPPMKKSMLVASKRADGVQDFYCYCDFYCPPFYLVKRNFDYIFLVALSIFVFSYIKVIGISKKISVYFYDLFFAGISLCTVLNEVIFRFRIHPERRPECQRASAIRPEQKQ